MKRKILGIVLVASLVLSLGLVFATPVFASPGIVGLWHFDEGSGATASDSSGNGNDGVLRMGTVLDFDGTDDYVSIPDSGAINLDGLSALTLEAWICPDNVTRGVIVGKYDTCGTPHYISYYLSLVDGKLQFFVGQDQSNWEYARTDSAVISAGVWYHVAGTWDGSSFKIYVNGIENPSSVTTLGAGTASMLDSSVDVELGALHCVITGGPSRQGYYNGKMGGVRISDVDRTSFEDCLPSVDINTVGLWQLDDGSEQTATDATGNSDGTLGNSGSADSQDPAWYSSGPTWAAGKCGQALSFDGVDDWVCVPDDSSLDITGAITVEGWIKLDSFSQQATVAGKWYDLNSVNNRGYLLTVTTAGKPRFYISTTGSDYPNAEGPTLSLDTWYHLAGTYDGANIKLYVNCVLEATTAQTGSINQNDEPLLIGANDGWGGSSRKFTDGMIDEVRIWDSATPMYDVDADPDTDVNPLGADHDVDVEVDIGGTDEPAMCVGVNLLVTIGPNVGDTDSSTADCNGEATLSYTGDGGTGTDTIRVWVDQDCSGDFDSGKDAYEEITKTWVDLTDLDPPVDYNPVGGQHCVTASVTPAVAGAEVFFEVSGANTASGSVTTGAGGTATFCYDGSNPGTDTILAYLDVNDNQSYDAGTDISLTVTKYWLEHFITGGGHINTGRGKSFAKISFGGNVGFDLAGNEVGQWNINFHNVKNDALDKGHFHSTEITSLVFNLIACPQPDPPDADYNKAVFTADGKFNGDPGWSIEVRLVDYGEPGKDNDAIMIFLSDGAKKVYLTTNATIDGFPAGDFDKNDPCTSGSNRHQLDGGNLQIHPPPLP